MGTNIDLKDSDVKMDPKKFVKAFLIHFFFLGGFGPIIAVFGLCDKDYLNLITNFGLTLTGPNHQVQIASHINWALTLAVPIMFIYQMYSTDTWAPIRIHEEGFDLVFTF